jgi:DNA polymerase V
MSSAKPDPLFSLVDCNNFYASCERIFAPKLEGTPIVVLSNNDGCVVARSNEAKKIGIKMGEPAFKVEKIFRKHNVEVFSSNYALYGDMSERVMTTLAEFVPEIEIYSIDEAFLDLTQHKNQNLTDFAIKLKKIVRQWTGIPVSIGIAPTKTLAKVANHIAKRSAENSGVLVLSGDRQIKQVLENFPVENLWGIGIQYGRFLRKNGILTALQLRDAPDHWVKKHLTVTGLRIKYELQGISCLSLEMAPPPKKGIGCSRTFREAVESKEALREAISTFAARCGEKLRRQNSYSKVVSVYIRTSPFQKGYYCNCKVAELPVATNHTPDLIRYALKTLEIIYKPNCQYKKAGVFVTDIIPATHIQPDLFHAVNREKQHKLMGVIDALNRSIGRDTITFAVQGINGKWKLRQERLSPRYTTQWEDLLIIRG